MDTLYTLREAAALTGLPFTTLRDAVTAGRLEHVRTGATGQRGVRVTISDVDRYLGARRRGLRAVDADSVAPQPTATPTVTVPASLLALRAVSRRRGA